MDARPTVCPLCEHAQAGGLECEQCGRPFGDGAPGEVQVEPLPGLEPAWAWVPGQEEERAGAPAGLPEPPAEAVPEPFEALEHNSLAADGTPGGRALAAPGLGGLELDGLDPSGLELEGLERNQAARVEVSDDRTPEMESHLLAQPEPEPGDPFRSVVCRYCHAEALPGETICGRCAMRLPVALATAPEGPAVRYCSCGAPVRSALCPACGARHA